MTVLASEPDAARILFADDVELTAFKEKVAAYAGDIPDKQKEPRHAALFNAIESVGELLPIDRIGPILKSEGFREPNAFKNERTEILDVELWPVVDFQADLFIHRITTVVESQGGTVLDQYRGASALLVRVQAKGKAIRALLDQTEVSSIDRPPQPDLPDLGIEQIDIGQIGEAVAAPPNAVAIGIVDSGLTSGHPLIAGSVIASFGVPASLGDDDGKMHGTPVSGIAAYGDLRQRIVGGDWDAKFRIASAKVVNAQGTFDSKELVPTQMEQAIRRLHNEFGCKVINISLGDVRRPVGLRPSAWAAALDELARELDLVIVVAAGNADRTKLAALGPEVIDRYPQFILDPSNRILEPGSAVNVLTVGSLAHGNGLDEADAEGVTVQSLCDASQPSPFTRIGPGSNGCVKPDLVDFGGTAVYDGLARRLLDGASKPNAGVPSLHSDYVRRQLLTSVSGTSFAAPLVAYKAALIAESLPDASANLVRALLALSADQPQAARDALGLANEETRYNVLGYGVADVARAVQSEDGRAILYREDSLAGDKFAVYEVPIPEEFQNTKGARQIRVALCFDPPVRHTRLDYAGISMGFNLLRGTTPAEVFDAFRRWEKKKEGEPFTLQNVLKCDMKPGPQRREKGTLQCATFTAKTNLERFGDSYYLAVRCESGWSFEDQRFAVAVELRHEAGIPLYERLQERVRIRV